MKNKNSLRVALCTSLFLSSMISLANDTRNTWCFEQYDALLPEYPLPQFSDWNKIIKQWGSYKKECEKTGEYKIYLAMLYMSSGRYQDARLLSEEVIKKYSKKFDIRAAERTLVLLDLLEKKMDSARVRSKELIKKYPDWYIGYNLYGGVLIQTGDDHEAEKYLIKANSIEENTTTFLKLSQIYLKRKDYKKFLEAYEKSFDQSILVLLARNETFVVVNIAIHLKKWSVAEAILTAQKYIDKEVVYETQYQELLQQVNERKKDNSLAKN